MQIPRSVSHLLGHATSSTPMRRLSPPSRRLLFYKDSAPICRWPPALAQRGARVMAALNPPLHRLPRLTHVSGKMASSSLVKGEEFDKQDRRSIMPSVNDPIRTSKDSRFSPGKHFPITPSVTNEYNRSAIKEFITSYDDSIAANGEEDGRQIVDAIHGDGDASRTTIEVTDSKQDICEVADGEEDAREATQDMIGSRSSGAGVQSASEVSDDQESCPADISTCYPCNCVVRRRPLRSSSHRDGSIYTDHYYWQKSFNVADRQETFMEDPSNGLFQNPETNGLFRTCCMWQVFSLKLVKIPMDGGPVELYGYIAARDHVDSLLNYIVNISRDDAITMEQGSLIQMTGPKRLIDLSDTVLIEYDMRIKTGDREEDDLQLIDGAFVLDPLISHSEPRVFRVHGNDSAIDISQMYIHNAVDATVEVIVSEVQSSFDLCLSCFTSGLHEEIRLFDGVIGESHVLRKHVIAVEACECLDLNLKVGSESYCSAEEHCCSFKVMNHGHASQQIKTEFASIFVKVTWPTVTLF